MDPPPHECLVLALEQLYALGALNHLGELTKVNISLGAAGRVTQRTWGFTVQTAYYITIKLRPCFLIRHFSWVGGWPNFRLIRCFRRVLLPQKNINVRKKF